MPTCRRHAARIRAIDKAAHQLFHEPDDRARMQRPRDESFETRASDGDGTD